MMTKEETLLRAKQAVREGRILEAGFIATMLPNAPDDTSEAALNMVRLAYFHGAKAMMQVLNKVAAEPEEKIATLMKQLEVEMVAFFRQKHRTPKEKPNIH